LQCTHAINAYLKIGFAEQVKKMPAKLMAGKSNREVSCLGRHDVAKIWEENLQLSHGWEIQVMTDAASQHRLGYM
jgi:hypothetical protein